MVISIQILTNIMMLWRGGFFLKVSLNGMPAWSNWWQLYHFEERILACKCSSKIDSLTLKATSLFGSELMWWHHRIKTSQYGVDDDDKDKIRDRSSAAKRESRQPLLVIDVNMWQDEQHTWCLLLMSIYLLSQYTPFDTCTYLLMPIYLFWWQCVTIWTVLSI